MDETPQTPPETPPAETKPETPPAPPVEPTVDSLDADLETHAIDIPDGDRLVPLSVVTALREKARSLKEGAERAATLETEVQALKSEAARINPVLEAAKALVAQAQAQAQQPTQGPQQDPPEAVAEQEAVARDLDLWKQDGTPDLERAKRVIARERANATAAAQQATAPLIVQNLVSQARANLARAKVTKDADGNGPDPAVLDELFGRLGQSIDGLRMLASPENARHVWNQAYAMSRTTGEKKPNLPPAPPAPKAPLHVEQAGGRSGPAIAMNAGDKAVARDLGLTDKQYQETLAKMPEGWGKNR